MFSYMLFVVLHSKYNSSNSSTLSNEWQIHTITPIYKSGNHSAV